ncbi:MAG TPA: winged helix-turn-helix domain-containing protein [Aliidongia sp.]|uniref:ATP-binding protein n=1 Tax=Aliidongia sp. TaxID=1914230 RepID=UPI002DDC9DAA|nr:winged helix-turn-helix domain-containing protein [Aliidongia sp.]HEV2674774.1 winged helix-turn-helix domain-containing protein [Aliidongia sp.]
MRVIERVLKFGPYRLEPDRLRLTCLDEVVPLGGRPFDLLVALVERRDRTVSKEELKALVWPTAAVVEDHTLVVTIAAVRKALASGANDTSFIETVAGRGYRFLGQVEDGSSLPSAPAGDPLQSFEGSPSTNLPTPPDRLIGREADMATLLVQLPKARLVTLLGPGGVGKTRLAIALATEVDKRHFQDGAWFVELAPLSDPLLVAETIAAMFGMESRGSRPAHEVVTTFLRRKELLLVLDNCEHLVDEVARLAEGVLKNCPNVTILATSRERLSIGGEVTYRVRPLTVPDGPQSVSVAEAMGFSAVRLFEDRATALLGDFVLTAESAPIVVEICRRLDGLALAIELAVAQLQLLEPADLLNHLDTRFRLLTHGSRTALPRHRTMQATIDWSYDLVTDPERTLLLRLSVFAGSFTVGAAAALAAGETIEAGEVIQLMLRLVDKSLIVPPSMVTEERRFRILESMRAYGLEKLAATDKIECLRRLAEHLLRLYEQGERSWPTTPTESWRRIYEPDLENLRTALTWAFGPEGDAALGVRLVGHTQELWFALQHIAELRRWLAIADARVDGATPPGVVARLKLAASRSRYAGERQYLDATVQAVELFRQIDEPLYVGMALSQAGKLLLQPGNTIEAEPYLREGVALLRALGLTKFLVTALDNMVGMCWYSDNIEGARAYLEEFHDMALELGHTGALQSAAIMLGELDFAAGRRQEAIKRARSARATWRRSSSASGLASISRNLAGYLVATGDVVSGREVAHDALKLSLGTYDVGICFQHLALAAAIDRDAIRSARLAGYSDACLRTDGLTRERNEHSLWLDLCARLEQALSAAQLAELLAEGAALSEEEAMALAA